MTVIIKLILATDMAKHFDLLKAFNGIYDEGISILSLESIIEAKEILLSSRDDYKSWKTRKALFAKTKNGWFGSIHTGMWEDKEESFSSQWDKLTKELSYVSDAPIFLMGDFNCPAHKDGEGYEKILSSGWFDTYRLASEKDEGFTTLGKIDGWETNKKQRIDYIFTNHKINVEKSETLFVQNPISDHLGLMITI